MSRFGDTATIISCVAEGRHDDNSELPKSVRDPTAGARADDLSRGVSTMLWLQYAHDPAHKEIAYRIRLEGREAEVSQSRRPPGPEGVTVTANDNGDGDPFRQDSSPDA
jgi:hypothetical protein